MGEALQDVFQKGYHTGPNLTKKLSCRKNYVISLTDGFPSSDTEWDRITDINSDPHLPFEDWDGDGWTADPSQYSSPAKNYYDDVGHWMYTHSYLDKKEVSDPANSYVNVITHHISFGMDHPLLEDAAGESGGLYISASNKAQLVAAFYALTLQMTEAVSFSSPVVSVDSANKIQNGDDLYLGLFLPQDAQSWMGNIKKFRLGDGSADRPDIWMIYDGKNNEAVNSSGTFLDNTAAFWADDTDANDSDNYGSADVKEDGVGELLTERVAANLASKNYWERPIYTYEPANTPNMKDFHYNNITKEELGVADDDTRDKIINYLHGYTYDVEAVVAPAAPTHAPTAVRDWALGGIVHSRPVVIDYYDPSDISILKKRYIAVGANDGMLHVFDDATGQEIFAFIPKDLLTQLKLIPEKSFVDTVDGEITLYRSSRQPKYLIFGLRKGGNSYWCLDISSTDPTDWSVKWTFTNSEIVQSWSAPVITTIPVSIDSTSGDQSFKDVIIFTGGYDPEEDYFPEPFNDNNNDGTPLNASGNSIDTGEWKKTEAAQDVYDNDTYDYHNPEKNESGRGIFAIDIDTAAILFSATYGATSNTSTAIQTHPSMKYCFPATPSIVSGSYAYVYKDAGGDLAQGRKSNILNAIYAIDIYSNVYRINYKFNIDDDTDNKPDTYGPFSASPTWEVKHIFSGNTASETMKRKAFYPPVISWGGSCNYFDPGNYIFTDTEFSGTYDIASIFFGTGDREHPTYTMIKNRFFSIYDDSTVSATHTSGGTSVVKTVTTIPYDETDLLNLTCNDLDEDSSKTDAEKDALKEKLKDDATYEVSANVYALEDGTHEDDYKGWYIIFEDQGDGNCKASYLTDHKGEKVLSKADLYAGILYFTTYQPSISDPCVPQGNGFAYSLNYCDATAAYNLDTSNDSGGTATYDIQDRSKKVNNIFGIPSDFAIITRKGQAGAMSMMGGKVTGKDGGNDYKIKSPGMGLELYYWRESNSAAD